MKRYNTVEEIKAAFIADGWSEDTNFELVNIGDTDCRSLIPKMKAGRKFFRMSVSGNIFDDNGEIALFNLHCI